MECRRNLFKVEGIYLGGDTMKGLHAISENGIVVGERERGGDGHCWVFSVRQPVSAAMLSFSSFFSL